MEQDLIDYISDELLELLQDEEVRSRVITLAADALPLPNFLEKRILGIVYGALLEGIKNATNNQ